MNRLASFSFVAVFIFASLFLSACSEKKSPEDEIRQYIVAGVTAVESREALSVRQLISENYMDEGRRDRRALVGVAMGYFLRHKNIHLFTQISEIRFPESSPSPKKANVKVYVAMAGTPVKGAQALLDIRANLYQFDLMLTKESGEWLLQKSRWQRASIEDLVVGE